MLPDVGPSILEYAGPAWNGCGVVDTTTLEKLQLRIAHSVLRQRGAGPSNSAVLQCVRWPTLAWRRRLQSLCLFWKLQNNLGPPSLSAAVPASASQRASRYSLRKPANLAFPSCSSRQHLKSFIPFCVALWNDLPAPIQSSHLCLLFVILLLTTLLVIVMSMVYHSRLYSCCEGDPPY